MTAWEPRDFTSERQEGPLVSGDRLLATYVEVAGGLGVSYLHRDGTITDGPAIPGYYTVGPVLSGDGRAERATSRAIP
jgi:hypothetical protein